MSMKISKKIDIKNLYGKNFKIIVKPNSSSNEILGYDASKNAYRINIKAPTDKNKANKEIVKFLSKKLGKKVRIKSGLTSKTKLIEVIG